VIPSFKIQSYIEEAENDCSLYEEKNFANRMEVVDFLGFQIIDPIEELVRKTDQPDKLLVLKSRAAKLRSDLEEIDITLFQRLRAAIRTAGYIRKGFSNLIGEYVDLYSASTGRQDEPGYDSLDILINGLASFQAMPEPTRHLEPEMVYYQKTPARIVFDLVEKSHFRKEDIFFDLGSGLGQVTMLVNLLTGIATKGVEFEPAFCDYARNCAAELNLSNVTFINVDARKADYSEGTIFFMYTPFRGEILGEVLVLLRKESLGRKIKIITYGPCTARVAEESWLDFESPVNDNMYKPGVFCSF
jgi:hypothetical protein